MIKAVLFDVDNTLVDFMKWKKVSVEHAVEAMIDAGLPMTKTKAIKEIFILYDKYGIEYSLIFQKFLKKSMNKIDYRILTAGIVAYRKVRFGYLDPYPHVVSTLIKLKEMGLRLGVVSDAPRIKAYLRLASLQLTDFFDVIITHEDTYKLKPNKEPFLAALKKLKTKPKETIMIGDWPARDIKGAKGVGMVTCLAKYGLSDFTKKNFVKPDHSVNDIFGLVDIIRKFEDD